MIKIYTRKSGNHFKFNYYDTLNKCYITPSDIFEMKKDCPKFDVIPGPRMDETDYYRALLNLVSHGTKLDLTNFPDPILVKRIILNGGLSEYILQLEAQ